MQNKLTAPSAKELYFKSILLFLANDDVVGADQAMKRYLNNDPTFFQTRQQKFVQAIITSVKEQNLGLFSNEWYFLAYSATNSTRSFRLTSGRLQFCRESRVSFLRKEAPPAPAKQPRMRRKCSCDSFKLSISFKIL